MTHLTLRIDNELDAMLLELEEHMQRVSTAVLGGTIQLNRSEIIRGLIRDAHRRLVASAAATDQPATDQPATYPGSWSAPTRRGSR